MVGRVRVERHQRSAGPREGFVGVPSGPVGDLEPLVSPSSALACLPDGPLSSNKLGTQIPYGLLGFGTFSRGAIRVRGRGLEVLGGARRDLFSGGQPAFGVGPPGRGPAV